MIKPLNNHYSFESLPSVYDEEAMTALELASRTAQKVNEVADQSNNLVTSTNQRMEAQDNAITKMTDVTMPAKVEAEVQSKIDSGEFDRAINVYAGDLEARVDNLLGQVVEGTTTGDAELIDTRTASNGSAFQTAGVTIRTAHHGFNNILDAAEIGADVTLTLNPNAYLTPSNVLQEHEDENWVYSQPISVPANHQVTLTAYGHSNTVAMISRYYNGAYGCLVRSEASGLRTYKYVTEKDETLVFSFNLSHGYALQIARANVGIMAEHSNHLHNAMVQAGKWKTPTLETIAGSYLTPQGSVVKHQDYCMTKPVRVRAGHTVAISAYGHLNQVSIISRLNQDGTYTKLVRSEVDENGVSQYKTYYYTAPADMHLVFSFSVAPVYAPKISIIYTGPAVDMVCLSVFRRFGVVGDSYASGELYYGSAFHDKYDNSWGQIMARKHGTECVNYSGGGLTTRSWLTNSKGLSLLKNTDPCDIYYLTLGINDSNNLGLDYIGSSADISTKADTFYGNYARIIAEIKAHAPKAKIVLFTIRENSDVREAFNEAIKEIAKLHGVPYIVQDSDEFFLSSFYLDTMDQGHPIAVTYSGMAEAYGRLLRNCVVENVGYFADMYEY